MTVRLVAQAPALMAGITTQADPFVAALLRVQAAAIESQRACARLATDLGRLCGFAAANDVSGFWVSSPSYSITEGGVGKVVFAFDFGRVASASACEVEVSITATTVSVWSMLFGGTFASTDEAIDEIMRRLAICVATVAATSAAPVCEGRVLRVADAADEMRQEVVLACTTQDNARDESPMHTPAGHPGFDDDAKTRDS